MDQAYSSTRLFPVLLWALVAVSLSVASPDSFSLNLICPEVAHPSFEECRPCLEPLNSVHRWVRIAGGSFEV